MNDILLALGICLAFGATIEFVWRIVSGKSFWSEFKKWLLKIFDVISGV